MKAVLFNLLAIIVKGLVDAKLFSHIQDLVFAYAGNPSLTGDQKRAAVKKELDEAKADIKEALGKTSSNLVNFAIEVAVIFAKKKLGN